MWNAGLEPEIESSYLQRWGESRLQWSVTGPPAAREKVGHQWATCFPQ